MTYISRFSDFALYNNVSGLFTFELFALLAGKTTFYLGTLDSGEQSLPFVCISDDSICPVKSFMKHMLYRHISVHLDWIIQSKQYLMAIMYTYIIYYIATNVDREIPG